MEAVVTEREVALSPMGWLSNLHVNVAQHLLKSIGTGTQALQDTIYEAHWEITQYTPVDFQAAQCHNIGNHWVTSTSVHGKIIVFESMSTSLNFSLKKQLVHLYRNFCKEDGSLEVTVIL